MGRDFCKFESHVPKVESPLIASDAYYVFFFGSDRTDVPT
jgi:hypothetical protein